MKSDPLQHSTAYLRYMAVVVGLNSLATTLVGLCTWLIQRRMHRMSIEYTTVDSDMLLRREREVRLVLLLQTITPALSATTVGCEAAYSLVGDGGEVGFVATVGAYASMPMSWIPVGNALVTLTLMRPYRQWVQRRCSAMFPLSLQKRAVAQGSQGRLQTSGAMQPISRPR